ncbi:MAG: DNA polymerase III subunit beta [Candidatus Omnitrophota bacterium]|nr:DNA polymerase III subunit beta [Candidatus Omnitrophota bacterium]
MEIQVKKAEFLKAIGLAGSVASSKTNTLPILGNLLLEAEDGDILRVIGTDLEVGISTQIEASVKKSGSITVPARKLHEIVRELPQGTVEVSVAKNNAVSIKSGKAFFKIMGLSKEDYPKLPEVNPEAAFEMEQAIFKESLTLTSFAISNDETRYVLNGILVSIIKNKIRFIATDGRRLAYIEKDFQNKTKRDFDMIVPSKAVQELSKILGWEGDLAVIPSNNQVIFKVGDTYLFSRLIEGNFPNYEQVIPKEEKTLSEANREDFLQAVKRTALLTSAESPAVKMDFVQGKILISSRSPNLGEAKEELPASLNGPEIAIGFNPNYLIDVLKNLDVEKVSFSLTDADRPGLLKGKDGYLYVVMPMQLN